MALLQLLLASLGLAHLSINSWLRCGQAEEEAAMWQERAEAAAEEAAATRSELLALGSELGNLQRLHSQEVSALAQPQQLHLAAD